MNKEWSLDEIYKGLEDPAYEADLSRLEHIIGELDALVKKAAEMEEKEKTEKLLLALEDFTELTYKISLYLGLRQSVDTENGALMAQQARLRKLLAQAAGATSAASKILAEISDVDSLAKRSELAAYYSFYLKENQKNAKHLFSDEVEAMINAMNMTGGAAWSQLQSYLTSTVKVNYEGKTVTLSEIRNLAYDADAAVRQAAYEAELAAYEQIQDAVAFSLNNIKNQVNMLAEKRGYESPLAMTLQQAKMKRETLDAMMAAIEEYLPVFRKYLKKKATMLGHANGLPWYDLYAPVGKSSGKQYTTEEAKAYLLKCFDSFSPEMSALMEEAFDNAWIDFYPRKGRRCILCSDAGFTQEPYPYQFRWQFRRNRNSGTRVGTCVPQPPDWRRATVVYGLSNAGSRDCIYI
jgi:oligoendopeptidase F